MRLSIPPWSVLPLTGFFYSSARTGVGITVLQMSKVDPEKLNKLDRRSTILLQAARQKTEGQEKDELMDIEEPGVDALRGGFGAVGSIIRARSAHRLSMASRSSRAASSVLNPNSARHDNLAGMTRHQLYDPPVRSGDDISLKTKSSTNALNSPRQQTIKFTDEEVRHFYPAGAGRGGAVHRNESTGPPAAMISGPKLPAPEGGNPFLYDDPYADDEGETDAGNVMTPGRKTGSKRRPFGGKAYPVNPEDEEERLSLVKEAAPEGGEGTVRLVPSRTGMI